MSEMDLFHQESSSDTASAYMPLAARMRPRTLQEYVGQTHLLGSGQMLPRLIESDSFSSLIFYGPPGTGKTTLSHIIAHETSRRFVSLSAVTSNVAELRQAIDHARVLLKQGQKTILFIDEIHRFNKSQQDILLPHIENGVISFIGATTHNPFFSLVAPLVSRSQVFRLKVLDVQEIKTILNRALEDSERGLGKENILMDEDAKTDLASFCEGDARRALNVLETLFASTKPGTEGRHVITRKSVAEILKDKPVLYDWDQDQHYDTISAFIKSVRGSDPDAALYWLAKMLEGGEDILFIARRLVILASEDIGNADPRALPLATSCLAAVEFIGLPEGRIPLAQTTIYLACAPKSNSAYLAIDEALRAVKGERVQEVPSHLKNVKAEDEKNEEYVYPHDFKGHIVEQAYLKKVKRFLELSDSGYEAQMKKRLEEWRQQMNPATRQSKKVTP